MKIREPAREVEVIHQADVVVVGSGPGGLAAALAAARSGVSVALVERFGCFGGNITTVGVEGFSWYRHAATVEAGGIAAEFEDRAKQMAAGFASSQSLGTELDSEGFKLVADRLVEEAGIAPMLHRAFAAPVMEGNRVTGIITESKAGREAILGRVVIDATGDADVAHRAGAPVHHTPREDILAASVMFHLAGVNKTRFMEDVRANPHTYADWSGGEWTVETDGKEDEMFSPFLKRPFEQARKDGLIPAELTTIAGTWGVAHDGGDLTYMNLVHLAGIDGTDPADLTRGEIEGRQQAMLAIAALRRYGPGFEEVRLRNFGMTLGIRDTRKIEAVHNLTGAEVRGEARFDDSIGIYPEFIDGYGLLILPTTGRYMHIPYRALVPQGVEGLLVAGRAIGGDRVSHAATRNMACCVVTGQGAGVAAAHAVKAGVNPRAIDIVAVQQELTGQGVRLA